MRLALSMSLPVLLDNFLESFVASSLQSNWDLVNSGVNQSTTEQVAAHGTDVACNTNDLQGDGDQSEVRDESNAQFLRDLFVQGDQNEPGGHLSGPPTSDPEYLPRRFATACLVGDLDFVESCFQHHVIAQGLVGAVQYNGQRGLRGPYNKETDRFEVTFGSGTDKTTVRMKPQNLILVNKQGEPIPVPTVQKYERELLEHRFGQLRRSPLMFCIIGAKLVPRPGGKWCEIANVLLDRGARPDCLDLLGRSVIWYGTGMISSSTGLAVSQRCNAMSSQPKLVDRRDRLGEVCLTQSVMLCAHGQVKELEFVCNKLGADPTIAGFKGVSPLTMCMGYPKAKVIVARAASKKQKKRMKKQKTGSKAMRQKKITDVCDAPECNKIGKVRCSRCLQVAYCGA